MTNKEIKNLIEIPKKIYKKEPQKGYKTENGYKRCKLIVSAERSILNKLQGVKMQKAKDLKKIIEFEVFIRQNQHFIENFSIGLVYKSSKFQKSLNIVRYNGPHDSETVENNKKKRRKSHHPMPHIHKMKEEDINSNSSNPKPTNLEMTKKYNSLEEGLLVFFKDINITNWQSYFSELEQGDLFNEH